MSDSHAIVFSHNFRNVRESMAKLPEKKPNLSKPLALEVLPMQVQDRRSDRGRGRRVRGCRPPLQAHVRVRRADNADVQMVRAWGAHESA
jgi:hypothetical protein